MWKSVSIFHAFLAENSVHKRGLMLCHGRGNTFSLPEMLFIWWKVGLAFPCKQGKTVDFLRFSSRIDCSTKHRKYRCGRGDSSFCLPQIHGYTNTPLVDFTKDFLYVHSQLRKPKKNFEIQQDSQLACKIRGKKILLRERESLEIVGSLSFYSEFSMEMSSLSSTVFLSKHAPPCMFVFSLKYGGISLSMLPPFVVSIVCSW